MTDRWINRNGGDYADGGNWSLGLPPSAGAAALLQVGGSTNPYIVAYDDQANTSLSALTLASVATLQFEASSDFAMVGNPPNFVTVVNAGALQAMGDVSSATNVEIGDAHTVNSGLVQMIGAGADDNSSFLFGGGSLRNSGTMELSGAGAFLDVIGCTVVNSGLMLVDGQGSATGAGWFSLEDDTINNAGGVIQGGVGVDDDVMFLGDKATVVGGTLIGAILVGGAPATLSGVTISAAAGTEIQVEGGGVLQLKGAIDNKATILVDSQDATGAAVWLSGKVTLSGAGTVELSPNSPDSPGINFLTATTAGASLFNVDDTLEGAGLIGADSLAILLDNEAGGTIEALGIPGLGVGGYGATLFIQVNETILNAGLIETSAYGSLIVDDAVKNTGTILAKNDDLAVNGAVTGTGVDQIDAGTLSFGASVAASQSLEFLGAGALDLEDPMAFKAPITGFAADDSVYLAGFDASAIKHLFYHENAAGTEGVLTVDDGVYVAHLIFAGAYSVQDFHASPDASGVSIAFV